MTLLTGKDALVAQLAADGVPYVFGNPGTTEQGFIEAIQRERAPEYILCLHEAVAVGIADAYSRATREPSFVQVHCSPGLGNAMGMIYDAYMGGTPMVVYVGQQSREISQHEPILAGHPAEIAKPLVKAAYEITRASDIPLLLRRAMKLAADPPQGPVCLAIPADVLDEETETSVRPSARVEWRSAPNSTSLEQAAKLLLSARNPLILSGDGTAVADASHLLQEVAHLVGCPIYTVLPSESTFDSEFPLFLGNLNVLQPETISNLVTDIDVILAVGVSMFPVLQPPLPSLGTAKLIQIDFDGGRIGRTYPPDIALRCDPRAALEMLKERLVEGANEQWHGDASLRRSAITERKRGFATNFQRRLEGESGKSTISPFGLIAEVASAIPPNAMVFEDAPTMSGLVQRGISRSEPGSLLMARGAGLGQGMPGTLGLKFAHPDRPVIGIVGDGSAQYTIQSLWTAARYNIDVTYVICNNGGYRILGRNMAAYLGGDQRKDFDPVFRLDQPAPDFVRLAEAYGVRGRRVDTKSELRDALHEAINSRSPYLVDVGLTDEKTPELVSREMKHAAPA